MWGLRSLRGFDFVPNSFVHGVVKKNAVLVSCEGDFGFSPKNGNLSAGHDVELVNFTSKTNPRCRFRAPGRSGRSRATATAAMRAMIDR